MNQSLIILKYIYAYHLLFWWHFFSITLQEIMAFFYWLIKKIPFYTFDNLTTHLFWTSHFEHAIFDGLSIWLMIFFTNINCDILTSQFVQMTIWLVVKLAVIFIHHMSSSFAIIIVTCQVECTLHNWHVSPI